MSSSTPDPISDGIVLVVEDDPSLRSALSAALSVRNIDHLEFETVDEIDVVLSRGTVTNPPVCYSTSDSEAARPA